MSKQQRYTPEFRSEAVKKQKLQSRNTSKSSITARDDTLVSATFHQQYLQQTITSVKKWLEGSVSTIDRTGQFCYIAMVKRCCQ